MGGSPKKTQVSIFNWSTDLDVELVPPFKTPYQTPPSNMRLFKVILAVPMGNIPVGESIGGAQANPKKPWMKSLWSLGQYKNGVVEYEHPGWEYWIMLLFWIYIYIYTYLHTYISTIGPLVPIVMITTGTIVIILVITKMKIQTIYVAVTMNNHDCGWLSLLPLVFIYIYILFTPSYGNVDEANDDH